jgi:tetratricopeptide (TPR) repeat protein
MERPKPPVHRTVLVVDVEGFTNRCRTNPDQVTVRDGLYRALQQAFRVAAIDWDTGHAEDRGDGVLFLALPEVPKSRFVDALPEALAEALRTHNDAHDRHERIRLRMALHAGEVSYDEHGVTGAAINLTFRLADAEPLKDALAASPGVLALIVSSWFYDEVVRNSPAAGPATYRRVPVAVKETTAEGWICLPDHAYPPDEADAQDRLVPVLPPVSAAPSAALSASALHPDTTRISGLPVLAPVGRLPEIRGRDELLADLRRLLRASRGSLVVLAGTGGVGKSAVAVSLIQHLQQTGGFRRRPRAWWVSAADRASLTGGLVTIARQLGAARADVEAIAGDATDAPDRLWALLNRVRRPWLLVLDNADDPSVLSRGPSAADGTGWLRRAARGLVVVTSRDGSGNAWGRQVRIVHVEPVGEADGARILLDGAPGAGTEAAARELARRLGGLPLALQLAGAYLGSEAALRKSFRDYLLALDDPGTRHRLLTSWPALDAPTDDRLIVMRTWEISLDALGGSGIPQARPLLRVLACYAPARPIPLWLLAPASLGPLLTCAEASRHDAEQRLEDGLHALLRMSLVDSRPPDDSGPHGRTLMVHPIIADTNRAHLRDDLDSDDGDRRAEAALVGRTATGLVTGAVSRLAADRIADWPRYLLLGPHLHALLAATAPWLGDPELRELVDAATITARAHNWSGAIPAGESLSRAAVSAADRLGRDDPAALRARHELGWPLVMRGQAAEAEALYRGVLAARVRVCGQAHPDTLTTRHELAWVAASRGRWAEAEAGYRDVLARRGRALGEEHPETLVTRHELAWAIANQGRYGEAEPMFDEVLAASRNQLSEDHPRILMVRHELAWAAANQGRWGEAERKYRELVAARRRILGEDHPDTLTTRNELAWVLAARGNHAAAVPEYAGVLDARRRALGPDHPDTLATGQALELLRQGRLAPPRHLA